MEAGNTIHDEVERVIALINNILSLSRMEMGSVKVERTRTRLVDLLRDALITTERDAKSAGVTVHLSEPPQPCVAQVDKDLMRIAVNNLLTNAVKYNRAEGEVYMTLAEDDACITISVRDTGIAEPRTWALGSGGTGAFTPDSERPLRPCNHRANCTSKARGNVESP